MPPRFGKRFETKVLLRRHRVASAPNRAAGSYFSALDDSVGSLAALNILSSFFLCSVATR